MAKTSNTPWVVAGGKIGEIGHCQRCGEGLKISDPQAIEVILAAINAFAKLHRNCTKTAETPISPSTPWEWIDSRDTGISSAAIWSVMMNTRSPYGRYDHPHDPDDFGRCYRLLELFPEWKSRLTEVSTRFPFWAPFIRDWSTLCEAYEREIETPRREPLSLYRLLRSLASESALLKSSGES